MTATRPGTGLQRVRDAAEKAAHDWAQPAGKGDQIPPQLWVLRKGAADGYLIDDLFTGAIPKDMSGADLVPVLRRLGVDTAAVVVPAVRSESTVTYRPQATVVTAVTAELIVVSAADPDGEQTRVAEISRTGGRPIVGQFSTFSGSAVIWPLQRLLEEAKQPSGRPLRATLRRIT